jgi:hypothetical protein
LFFSRATPNLATVIPAMDHIDEVLATRGQDTSLQPAIRVALNTAKKTLNAYYNKTDQSDVYRIAMSMYTRTCISPTNSSSLTVLHPRHKLKYFERVGWKRAWIKTAEDLVRTKFEDSYASLPELAVTTPVPDILPTSDKKKVRCACRYMLIC